MENLIKEQLVIKGMTCNHCIKAVEDELSKLALKSYEVYLGYAKVEYNAGIVTEGTIIDAISSAGYEVINTILEGQVH